MFSTQFTYEKYFWSADAYALHCTICIALHNLRHVITPPYKAHSRRLPTCRYHKVLSTLPICGALNALTKVFLECWRIAQSAPRLNSTIWSPLLTSTHFSLSWNTEYSSCMFNTQCTYEKCFRSADASPNLRHMLTQPYKAHSRHLTTSHYHETQNFLLLCSTLNALTKSVLGVLRHCTFCATSWLNRMKPAFNVYPLLVIMNYWILFLYVQHSKHLREVLLESWRIAQSAPHHDWTI
jgi:hypothetical protein